MLGALFRYKSNQLEKTNLMVFIRPTILRDAAVTSQLTPANMLYPRETLEVQRRACSR